MEPLKYYLRKQIKRTISSMTTLENVCFDAIYFDNSDNGPILEMLCKPIPGMKKYGYRIDIPFGEQRPGNQKHMHIYVKQNEVFAINVDGTAHDGYHNVKIPDEIAPFIQSKGITLPPNNIIECLTSERQKSLLQESHSRSIGVIQRVNQIAIVITNESINTIDVICNPKIREHYRHANVLVALDEKYLDNVLNDIAKDIEEAGHEMHIIPIFDSHYISERRKLYVVWS